jgi:KaiC/GvpD/RAD55 family RecA-like ATPase
MIDLLQEYKKGVERVKDNKLTVGYLDVQSVNGVIADAAKLPDPKIIIPPIIVEGENTVAYSQPNVGKSIMAVQWGEIAAKGGHTVVYADCELSNKQFEKRYTDSYGVAHIFPDSLFRVSVNHRALIAAKKDYIKRGVKMETDEIFIKNIEEIMTAKNADVLIVDNISYLCKETEKPDAAGTLMTELSSLKFLYGWTLIILAHTPKQYFPHPISMADLAGSAKLMNFFDAAIAFGNCQEPNTIYMKQIKCRMMAKEYDTNNVVLYERTDDGGYLHMEFKGYADEMDCIKSDNKDVDAMQEKVMELHSQGKSLREIGSETGLSKNKVDRLIKKSVPVSRFPSGTGQSDENNLQSTDNQQVTENGSVPPLGQQSIEWDSSGTAVGQPF